jgi:ABC-type branched-subunit amino acid transport system substrate-binding protein
MEKGQILNRAILSFIALSVISLASCSETRNIDYRGDISNSQSAQRQLLKLKSEPPKRDETKRFPWEVWSYERDISGDLIRSKSFVDGDNAYRFQGRGEGLKAYYEIQKAQPLDLVLRRALSVRIASAELSLDRPQSCLNQIAEYARYEKIAPQFLPAVESLILGYCYGRSGDIEQSLAWFSRVIDLARLVKREGNSPLILVDSATIDLTPNAETGVRQLLKVIPQGDFENYAEKWRGHDSIAQLFAEERAERATRPLASQLLFARAFEAILNPAIFNSAILNPGSSSQSANLALLSDQLGSGDKSFVALLPLSGAYHELGLAIKNGIEVARSGLNSQGGEAVLPIPEVFYQDTRGAAEGVDQILFALPPPSLIFGPLLADESNYLKEKFINHAVKGSVIAFSKRADFVPYPPLFRIAPTIESQTEALIEAIRVKSLKKIAVITASDQAGVEIGGHFVKTLATYANRYQIKVVYQAQYNPENEGEVLAQAAQVEKISADAIFFPGTLNQAGRFFTALKEGYRKKIVPLGFANWDSPQELKQSSRALEGAIFVSLFNHLSQRQIVSQFITIYRTQYGEAPTFIAAQAFDAATIAFTAWRYAIQNNVSVSEALLSLAAYEGLCGRINVLDNGELFPHFATLELNGGVIKEVSSEIRL